MIKKFALIACVLALTATYQPPSWAGKVLDRIRETGTITAGTRKDAVPFGFIDKDGKWVGYSLDILELIRKQTEKQLGKPIQLKLVEATPENRFEKIKNGSIEIECASTTFPWERTKQVDFSVS